MKILLAIDDSSFSATATEFLATHFRPDQAEVMVQHATASLTETDLNYSWAPNLDWEGVRNAEEIVARAADRLRHAGFEVTTQVGGGDARLKVVEAASDWPADLIILGSHGRTGLDRLLLGSVSENVARSAPCSVAVIRSETAPSENDANQFEEPNEERRRRVLLAIDDSAEFSEATIQAVGQQMYPNRTEICVLNVIDPIYSTIASYSYVAHAHDVQAAQEKLVKRGEGLVARAGRLLRNLGFKVMTAVESGDARVKIVDYASQWMADLIVVSSHGRTGLDRLLMGSVSENVIRHAHCSVEVVRPAAVAVRSSVVEVSAVASVENA
jgi:nucleotide-binding universal stress UspA family protein